MIIKIASNERVCQTKYKKKFSKMAKLFELKKFVKFEIDVFIENISSFISHPKK